VEAIETGIGDAGPAILTDISLTIAAGEVLCVVGESGSGKSMLALSVMGLLPPPIRIRSGAIRLDGEDLAQLSPGVLRAKRGGAVAMIFQEPMTSLNPVMRVGQQIAEVLRWHRNLTGAGARTEVVKLLRRVEIPSPEERADSYPHELSGGMRQRVMIAMALAGEPRLLIADEPTTALDVTIQAQILELVRDLQAERGMGVMLITHDLGVVAEMADRVAVMYAGLVVETGSASAIFDAPAHPYTRGLMASRPSLQGEQARLATIEGQVPGVGRFPQGCRFAPRCPLALPECADEPPFVEIAPGHRAACIRALEIVQREVAR
jgi:oligopeptide/dipeptide ABC transporter ATP-binding protein